MLLSVPHVILLLLYYCLLPDISAHPRHTDSNKNNSDLIPWADVPQLYKVLIDEAENVLASSPRSDIISRNKGNTDTSEFDGKSLDDEDEGRAEKKTLGADEKKKIFNINRFLPFALTTKLSQWRNTQSDKDEEDREAKDLKKALRHQDSFDLDRSNSTPAPDRFKSEEDEIVPDRLQAAPKVLLTLINKNPRLVSKLLKKLFNSSARPQKFKLPPLEPPDDLETNFFIAPKAALAYKQPTETGENVHNETEQLINSQSATTVTSDFSVLPTQNYFLTNKIDSVQPNATCELSTEEVPVSTGFSYTHSNFDESLTNERQIESKPVGKSHDKPRTTTVNPGEESQVQEVESILKTVMEILSVLNKTEESSTSASSLLKSLARDANIVDSDAEGECRYANNSKPKDFYECSDEDLNKVLKLIVNLAVGTSKPGEIDSTDSTKFGELVPLKQTGIKLSSVKGAEKTLNNVETEYLLGKNETAEDAETHQVIKSTNPICNISDLSSLLDKLADQDKDTEKQLVAIDQKDYKLKGKSNGVTCKEVLLDKPIISSERIEPNRGEEVSSVFAATTEPSILLDVPLTYYNEVLKLINRHPSSRNDLSENGNSLPTLQSSEKYNELQNTKEIEPLLSLEGNDRSNLHSYDYSKGTSSLEEAWLENDVSDDYTNHEQQESSLFGLGADKSKTLEANIRNVVASSISPLAIQNSTETDVSSPKVKYSNGVAFIQSAVENSTVVTFTAPAEQNSPVVAFYPSTTIENATKVTLTSNDNKLSMIDFATTLNAICVKDESKADSNQHLELVKSNLVENTPLLSHTVSKTKDRNTEEEKTSVVSSPKKQALKDSTPKKQSLFNKIFCSLFGSSNPDRDVSCVKGKKFSTNSSNATLKDSRELMEVRTGTTPVTGGLTSLPPVLGHQISNKNDFKEYFLTEKCKTDLAFLKYIPGAFRVAPTHPTVFYSSKNVEKGQPKSAVGVNRVYNMSDSSSPKENIFVKGYESENNSEMSIEMTSLKNLSQVKTNNKSIAGDLLTISSDETPNIVNKVVAHQTQVNLSKDKPWHKDPNRGHSNYFLLSTEHYKPRHSTMTQLKLVAGKENNNNNISVGFSLPVGKSSLPAVSTLPNNFFVTTSPPPYEALLELITPFKEKYGVIESESDTNASVVDNELLNANYSTYRNSLNSTNDVLQAADAAVQRYKDANDVTSGQRRIETVTRGMGNIPASNVAKANLTCDVSTVVNSLQNYEIISGQGVLPPTAQNASWDKLKISPLVIIESTGNGTIKRNKSNHTRVSNYATQNTLSPEMPGLPHLDTVSNVVDNLSKPAIPRNEMANIKLYIYDPPFEEAYSYTTVPSSTKPTESTPTNWEKRFQQKLLPIPNLQLVDRPPFSQQKHRIPVLNDNFTDSTLIKLDSLPIETLADTSPMSKIEIDETLPASSVLDSINSIGRTEKLLTNGTLIRNHMGDQGEFSSLYLPNNLEHENYTSRVQSENKIISMLDFKNNSFQTSVLKEEVSPNIHSGFIAKNLTKVISVVDNAFDSIDDGREIYTIQSTIKCAPDDNSVDNYHDSKVCIGEVEDVTNTMVNTSTESESELNSKLKNENSAIQYTVSADDRKTHHNALSTPPVYVVHNFMKDSKEIPSQKVMWKRKKTTYPILAAVHMSTKPAQAPANQIVTPQPGFKSQLNKQDNANNNFLNDFIDALDNALKVEHAKQQPGELLDIPTVSSVFIDKTMKYADSSEYPIPLEIDYTSTQEIPTNVPMFDSEQSIFTTMELFTEAAETSETQAVKPAYPEDEIQINPDLNITTLLTLHQSTGRSDIMLPSILTNTQQNLNREDKLNLSNSSKLQGKTFVGPFMTKNSVYKGLNRTKTLSFIDTLMHSDNPDLYAVLNWTRSDNTSSPSFSPLSSTEVSLEENVRMRNSSTMLEEPIVTGDSHLGRHYYPGVVDWLNKRRRYKFRALLQNRQYSGNDDKRPSQLSEYVKNNDIGTLGSGDVPTNLTKSKRNPVVQSIIATTATPNQIVVHRVITTQNGGMKATMSPGFSNLAEKMTGDNEAVDKEAELRAFMGLNATRTQSPRYLFNINTDPRLKSKDQPMLLSKVGYGFTSERSSYKQNLRMRWNGFDITTSSPLFQLHNYLSDTRPPEGKDPHQVFNIYILNKAKNSQNPSVSNSTEKMTTSSQTSIINKSKNKKHPFYKRMNIFRKFGLCRDVSGPKQIDINVTTEKIDENENLNGTIREDIANFTSVKPESKNKLYQVTPVIFRVTSTEKIASKPTKQVKSTGTSPLPSVTVTSSANEALSHLTNFNSSFNYATTFSCSTFENASTEETVIRMSEGLENINYVTSNPNSYMNSSSNNRPANGSQIATGEPYVLWIPEYRYKIYNDYLYNISNRMNFSNTAVELKEDKKIDQSTPRNKFKFSFKKTNVVNIKGDGKEKTSSKELYNVTTSQLVDVHAASAFPSMSAQGVLPDKFFCQTTQVYTGINTTSRKIPNVYSYKASLASSTTEVTPDRRSSLDPQTSTEHNMSTNNWTPYMWYASTTYEALGVTQGPVQNSTLQRTPCMSNGTKQISSIDSKHYYSTNQAADILTGNVTGIPTTERFIENFYPANSSYSRYYDPITSKNTWNSTESVVENTSSLLTNSTVDLITAPSVPLQWTKQELSFIGSENATDVLVQHNYSSETPTSSTLQSISNMVNYNDKLESTNFSSIAYTTCLQPEYAKGVNTVSPSSVSPSSQELSFIASENATDVLLQHNYSSETPTSSTLQSISNMVNYNDKLESTNFSSISYTTCLQPEYAKGVNTVSPSPLRITSDVFETSTMSYYNVSSGNIKFEYPNNENVTELNSFSSGSEKVVDERLEIGTTSGPLYSEAIYVPNENGFEIPSTVIETCSVKDTEPPEFHIGTTVLSTKDLVVSVTQKNVFSLEEMNEPTTNVLISNSSLTGVTTDVIVQETTIGRVNQHLDFVEEAVIHSPTTSVDINQLTPDGGGTEISSSQTSSSSYDIEGLPSVTSSGESTSTEGLSNLNFLNDITAEQDVSNDNLITKENEISASTDSLKTLNTARAVATDLQDAELNLLTDEYPCTASPQQLDVNGKTEADTNDVTLDLDSVSKEICNVDTLDSSESDSVNDNTEETKLEESVEVSGGLNDFSTQVPVVLTPNPNINLQLIDLDQQKNDESSDSSLKAEEVLSADDSKSENETEGSENIELTLDNENRGENSTSGVLTLTASKCKTMKTSSKSLEINRNDQRTLFNGCLKNVNDSQSHSEDDDTKMLNDYEDMISRNISISIPGNVMVGALEKVTKWSLFEGSRVSTQCTVDIEDTTCPLTEETTCDDSQSDHSTTVGMPTTCEESDETTCEETDKTTCEATSETTCETTCEATEQTTCETTVDTIGETTCETTVDSIGVTTCETNCEGSSDETTGEKSETTCKSTLLDEFDIKFDFKFDQKYGYTTEARKSHPTTKPCRHDDHPTKKGKKKKGKGHHSTTPSVCSVPVYTQDEGILSSENEFWRTLSTQMCANSVTRSGRLKIINEKSISCLNLGVNAGESVDRITGEPKNIKETCDENFTKYSKLNTLVNSLNDNRVNIDIKTTREGVENVHASVLSTTEGSDTSNGVSMNLDQPDQSNDAESTIKTATEPLGFQQSEGSPDGHNSEIISETRNGPLPDEISDSIDISETLNEGNQVTANPDEESTEEPRSDSLSYEYFLTTVPHFISQELSSEFYTDIGSTLVENSNAQTMTQFSNESEDSSQRSVIELDDTVLEECVSNNKQSLLDQEIHNQAGRNEDTAASGECGNSENIGEDSYNYPEGRIANDSLEYNDVGVDDLADIDVDSASKANDVNSSTDESNEEAIAKKVYLMSILSDGTSLPKNIVTPSEVVKTLPKRGHISSSLSLSQTDFESTGELDKNINRSLAELVDSFELSYASSDKSKNSVERISSLKETGLSQEKQNPPGSEVPIDEIRPNAFGPGRHISSISTTHNIKETKGVTIPSVSIKPTKCLRNMRKNKLCNRSLDPESAGSTSLCSTLVTEKSNLLTSTESSFVPSLTEIISGSLQFNKPQSGRNSLENAEHKTQGQEPTEWRADQEGLDFSMPEDHRKVESHSLTERIWEVLSKAVKAQSYNPHPVETEKRSDLLDFNSSHSDKSANDSKADVLSLPKSANSIFINENSISKINEGTGKSRKEAFEQKNRGRKIFGLIQKEFNNSKIYNSSDMNYYLSKIQIPSVDAISETITTEPKALILSTSSNTVEDEMERRIKPSPSRTIADLLKIDPLLRYILDLGSSRTNKPLISDPVFNISVETGEVVKENAPLEEGRKRFYEYGKNATSNPQSASQGDIENWDDLVDQFRDPILSYDYPSDASGHCGLDSCDIQGYKGRRNCQEEHSGIVSVVKDTLSLNGSKQECGTFKIGSDTDGQLVDSNNFSNISSAPDSRFIGLYPSDVNSWKKKSRTEGCLFAKDSGKLEKKEKNKIYEFSMGTYRPIQVRSKRSIDINQTDMNKESKVQSKSDDEGREKCPSKLNDWTTNRAVRSRSGLRKIQEVLNPWEGGKKGNYVSPSERRKIAKILEAIEANNFDDSDDVMKCTDLSSAKKSMTSKPKNIKVDTKNIMSHKVKQSRRKPGYLLNNWGKYNKTVVYPYFSQVENPIKGKCISSRPNTLSYNISESFFDKGDNGTALLCHVDLKITTKNYTLAPESADEERSKYSCFYHSPTSGGKPNVFVQYSPVYQSETNFSHAPHDYTTFLVKRVHKSLDQEYKYVVINLNNIFYITVELNGDIYTYSDRTTPLGSRTVAKKPGRRKKNYKYLPNKRRKNKKNAPGTRSEPKNKSNKRYLPRKHIKLHLMISDRPG